MKDHSTSCDLVRTADGEGHDTHIAEVLGEKIAGLNGRRQLRRPVAVEWEDASKQLLHGGDRSGGPGLCHDDARCHIKSASGPGQ